MQKFSFLSETDRVIYHNLPPEMEIQLIFNDEDEYDIWNDCFELFEFRGNKIVVKWLADEEELNEVEDFGQIRSILRRAWQWYKSQVYIEKKEYLAGPMEDDRYILDNQQGTNDWLITDKDNLIVAFFENHKFIDTQRIVNLEDFTKEQIAILPRILREMSDWLAKNHYDKIF